MILDVDGTLYPPGGDHVLELEIIRRIHKHCAEHYGISSQECDRLHREFGSTIDGLRVTKSLSTDNINFFYEDVYGNIDVRWLLSTTTSPQKRSKNGGDSKPKIPYTSHISSSPLDINEEDEMENEEFEDIDEETVIEEEIMSSDAPDHLGIEHDKEDLYNANEDRDGTGYSTSSSAFTALKNFDGPIVIASNSPLLHVQRVMTALGLANLSVDMIITPDSDINPNYFTKSSKEYWKIILDRFPMEQYNLFLIDDSKFNLKKAASMGIRGQQVAKNFKLEEAMAVAVGSILPPIEWSMNDIKYIDAKNEIDKSSLSKMVLQTLEEKVIKKKELQRELLNRRGGKGWSDMKAVKPNLASKYTTERNNEDSQPLTTSALYQKASTLKVLDLGAGLLSMLPHFMKIKKKAELQNLTYMAVESNPLLVQEVIRRLTLPTSSSSLSPSEEEVEGETLPQINGTFHVLSRRPIFGGDNGSAKLVGVGGLGSIHLSNDDGVEIIIHCCPFETISRQFNVDVVVGCCLIDLIDPVKFIQSIIKVVHVDQEPVGNFSSFEESSTTDIDDNLVGRNDNNLDGPLLYFPISFAGRTTFKQDPSIILSKDEEESISSIDISPKSNVPSDSIVTKYYHHTLRNIQGHYINLNRFQSVLEDFGCPLITSAPSSWIISNKSHPYMYRSILRFIGLGLLPITLKKRWDLNHWIQKKLIDKSSFIDITNVDLLFELRSSTVEKNGISIAEQDLFESIETNLRTNSFVQFEGPRSVKIEEEEWHLLNRTEDKDIDRSSLGDFENVNKKLSPRGVELEAVASLISAGTELKIFRGDFKMGEKTDTNIEAFKDSTMEYPMKYGYSHVGKIIRVGSDIKDTEKEKLLGSLVFTFSPHESRVIIDDIDANGGLMLVPDGISAEDAVFLPSVETALSLIHDANPLCGETVAVIGQGLIGLLVIKLLRRHCGVRETMSCDLSPCRRAQSKLAGSKYALSPDEFYMYNNQQTSKIEKPDITIEVSGHPSGLQTAIDNTRFGGKIILGSWYGDKAINSLVLGLGFHRSHLQLITSQVSDIPARLTNRWSKKRRFDTTWKILRDIQPSKWLASKTISLTEEEVQSAYESLDKSGETIGVIIKY